VLLQEIAQRAKIFFAHFAQGPADGLVDQVMWVID
jgi:hypothetical protein